MDGEDPGAGYALLNQDTTINSVSPHGVLRAYHFAGQTLQLYQNKQLAVWDGSFGLVTWNAAVVITRMLEHEKYRRYLLGDNAASLGQSDGHRQLTVLDVGAGSGLTGLALGVLGAQVMLTDYEPRVVAQLQANVALNASLLAQAEHGPLQLEVTAAVLDWCAPKSFYDSALNGDTAEVAIERYLQRLLGWKCRLGVSVHDSTGRVGVISTAPDIDLGVKLRWENDRSLSDYVALTKLQPMDAVETKGKRMQQKKQEVLRGARERGFDLIIASDLLYNATEDTWPQLAATLATICGGGAGTSAAKDAQGAHVRSEDGTEMHTCKRGTYRESMVLLGFQKRNSVSQHDFFEYAREWFDIAALDVPPDIVASIVTAQEEGELGAHKSHLVELYRLVLKAGGTGGQRWWEQCGSDERECKAHTNRSSTASQSSRL